MDLKPWFGFLFSSGLATLNMAGSGLGGLSVGVATATDSAGAAALGRAWQKMLKMSNDVI